jgi:hypothetical protein
MAQKTWQNLMSLNIFTKMVPFFYMLLTRLTFFVKKRKEKSAFVNFIDNVSPRYDKFSSVKLHTFASNFHSTKMIVAKMLKLKFSFQP